ncbi:MAG: fumarate hydratase [Treponema sp.]|jgi:fumarate hydratase subunit alpha|nr:fumarate hydratase [Treponema sp.]
MRIVEAALVGETVRRLCIEANRILPPGLRKAIKVSREKEDNPLAREVLDSIIENYELAEREALPVCQDTGIACVFLETGTEVHISGDIYAAINRGVSAGYTGGFLRSSVVADPLFSRKNTGDNTPAMIYTEFVPGDRVTVTVAPKGFGSENMSRIAMLSPSGGEEGITDFVLKTVKEAGPNPCPPIVLGLGIGGNFDKAALLSKKALLRPPGEFNSDPRYAELEKRLLEKINGLGIGPAGYGGRSTALSVAVETLPTHIAGLPCAVNISCHVCRHAREIL